MTEKRKRGRPTKFNEQYHVQKVHEYLKNCSDEYDEKQRLKVNLPTIEGFADFIDINKTTIYDWKKSSEDFSHALDKIINKQKKNLLDSGLSGAYNPTIAKLILSSNHGFSEKSEQKVEISGFGKGHRELMRLEEQRA